MSVSPHAIEVDAAIALVSLIAATLGGIAGLVWLAYMGLQHWLRGETYPRRTAGPGDRGGPGASGDDTPGGSEDEPA